MPVLQIYQIRKGPYTTPQMGKTLALEKINHPHQGAASYYSTQKDLKFQDRGGVVESTTRPCGKTIKTNCR
jgi:hypothetical protein